MSKVIPFVLAIAAAAPVYAAPQFNTVPLPATLPLAAIGVLAYLLARRFKK